MDRSDTQLRLDLRPEEAEALRWGIDRVLPDLQSEIYHTEDFEYREALKRLKAGLQGVRKRLNAFPTTPPQPEPPQQARRSTHG